MLLKEDNRRTAGDATPNQVVILDSSQQLRYTLAEMNGLLGDMIYALARSKIYISLA